jgi:hypothetical protein
MRRTGPLALAVLLLASCSGPMLFAEIEIPDLTVTLPRQAFPAFDAGNPANWCNPSAPAPPPIPCVGISAAYDLGAQVPALTEKGVTYELRITDVAFTLSATQSTAAPANLGGIKSATIRVGADPSAPGSGVVIASYVRPGAATPATITVSGNANVDLAPYIRSGTLPLRVEVVVDDATPAFDADILATFYVKVTLDWGKYL